MDKILPILAVVIMLIFIFGIFFLVLRLHGKIKPRSYSNQIGANINGSGSRNDVGKR